MTYAHTRIHMRENLWDNVRLRNYGIHHIYEEIQCLIKPHAHNSAYERLRAQTTMQHWTKYNVGQVTDSNLRWLWR